MQFQYTTYNLPLIAAVLISGFVAIYSWRHRATHGAIALAVLALALAEWAFTYGLEIAGADLQTKLFWAKLEYLGIVTVPLSWMIFAFDYANQGGRLTRRVLALLCAIPVLTFLLVSTTEIHGLVWRDLHVEQGVGFSVLGLTHGPWFWVHIAYSYILLLVGAIIVLRSIGRMQGVYRGQAAALIVAVIAPWVGNVIYLGGLSPIPLLDPTPFAFTITVVAVSWGIFGFRLLDLSPIARENFVDEMQDGMIVLDTQNRIADINPAALRMIAMTDQKVIGRQAADVLSSWQNLTERYINTLEATDEISFGEGPDKRWYELRLTPLYDRQKRLLGRAVTIRNITAPRQAEEFKHSFLDDMKALQEIHLALSEIGSLDALYISMVRLAQQRLGIKRLGLFLVDDATHEFLGTYGVDEDGNSRDESYFRAPLDSPDWQWHTEVLNSPNHARLWENADIFDNGVVVGTGWKAAASLWNGHKSIGYLSIDGFISHRPPRPYEADLISLLGSTFGHLIERTRAELKLQQSEARYRQIVETASDVIYRTDHHGRFTYINPVGLHLLGLTSEAEMLGKHYIETAAPAYRHDLKRFYNRQYLTREKNTYREFPIVTADGREIWLGQNVQLIEEDGKVVGFQAVARDVTELREVQESLALARDQALEASRLKSQLLAKVSHELRTPLGGVLGYAELLHFGAFGPLDEKQTTATAQIIDSTNYLKTMVNELLDEAQIEAKSVTLHNTRFNLREMVHAVETNIAVLASKKGLSLRTSIAPDLPEMLRGDPQRLQQILFNLASNAIKFTTSGEVAIRLNCPEPEYWAIQVSDTGVGIPKEAQSYIFEPFRQANNAITRENRGTGLGLSIAKQLVELMGGEISIESEVDHGSSFTVRLPILKETEKTL